ncbi:MAG TPA: hypothetical protein VI387_01050 [Candidatus Brocadiales bacterium]|nr:hypothetical protein [Candidatus Brocadiales bacterium]
MVTTARPTALELDDLPLYFYLKRNREPHESPKRECFILVQGIWINKVTNEPANWHGYSKKVFILRKKPTFAGIDPVLAAKGAFNVKTLMELIQEAGKNAAKELFEYSKGKHWQCKEITRVELHEEIKV